MNDRSNTTVAAGVIEKIRQVVGTQGILTAAADLEPYIVDWRGVYRGAAAILGWRNAGRIARAFDVMRRTGE